VNTTPHVQIRNPL